MAFTHTELLAEIKTRGMIPTSQSTFTTARFLSAINQVMWTKIIPLVLKVRENYYSYDIDTSVNATGEYHLSKRAIGGKVQNVALISGTERLDLPWLSEEELVDTSTSPSGAPGFYIKRNTLYLVPATGHGYSTLRVTIFLRPPEVVAQSSAAQITAIAGSVLSFTSGTIPSTFTTSLTYELVQQHPHFDTLGFDLAASAVGATSVTMTVSPSSRLAVGDWLSLTGQSPIIQCPVELQPLLAQEVANYCLRAQGDLEAYKMGLEEAKRLREDCLSLITPRVEKEGKKLVNRTGILRRS